MNQNHVEKEGKKTDLLATQSHSSPSKDKVIELMSILSTKEVKMDTFNQKAAKTILPSQFLYVSGVCESNYFLSHYSLRSTGIRPSLTEYCHHPESLTWS